MLFGEGGFEVQPVLGGVEGAAFGTVVQVVQPGFELRRAPDREPQHWKAVIQFLLRFYHLFLSRCACSHSA